MDFLYPLTITVLLLFILSFISNKLNFFSIPLFILGGIFLKPVLINSTEIITLLSQLGLLLLLFYIGFEISPIRYLKNIRKILYDGVIDLILSFIFPFFIIFAISGQDFKFSIFISSLLYISSSAIDLKIIVDSKFTIYSFAERAINILLFQDIVISFLIIILPLIFVEFTSTALFMSLSNIFIFAFFLSLLYIILKFTGNFINRSADETIILLSFAVMVLSSYISCKLINSEVLGAFMAGSIIKACGYRIDIKKTFSPIKDIFSPFFFFYFGLNINLSAVSGNYIFTTIILMLAIITKYIISYVIYPASNNSVFRNILFGLLTIRGEFSIVLAAVSSKYLDEKTFHLLSMMSTTIIFVNIILGLILVKKFNKRLYV